MSGPSYRIYVSNLPWDVDDIRLELLFSEHGKVVNARVVYDRESGRSRGFGFVTMSTESELNDAIEILDVQSMDGRAIRESGRSRGFGFVTMSTESELNDAIEILDVQSMGGRAIRVNVAEELRLEMPCPWYPPQRILHMEPVIAKIPRVLLLPLLGSNYQSSLLLGPGCKCLISLLPLRAQIADVHFWRS